MSCNRRPDLIACPRAAARRVGRAFTLVELIVCLAVVALLTAMLMPALRHVREAALRIHCASNMHQIGIALTSWADSHNDWLPASVNAEPATLKPQELMAATIGPDASSAVTAINPWDGLGWLAGSGYLGCTECLYCPSHHGDHAFERYAAAYRDPTTTRIYTNYHYAGHVKHDGARNRLTEGHELLLLTDGLRTQSDFNHVSGCNRLFGDISTDWWYDAGNQLRDSLPMDVLDPSAQLVQYSEWWGTLEKSKE